MAGARMAFVRHERRAFISHRATNQNAETPTILRATNRTFSQLNISCQRQQHNLLNRTRLAQRRESVLDYG